jgi:hypothetical protein
MKDNETSEEGRQNGSTSDDPGMPLRETRQSLFTARNISIGLVGGCVTFLVSFIAVFLCSASVAGFLGTFANISFNGKQMIPFFFLSATILAIVFLIWFAVFTARRQQKLSQEVPSRQRDQEQTIAEQQRSDPEESGKAATKKEII